MSESPSADLDELFARDPLELSKQDINVIVDYCREKRDLYLSPKPAAPAKSSSKSAAAKSIPNPNLTLNLSDLGFDV